MKKAGWMLAAVAACALCAAAPLAAAGTTTAKSQAKKTAVKESATKAATAKTAAKKTATASKKRSAWPPETLSAKIVSVDAARDVLVIQTPDQVDYDMTVNAKTRIESGGSKIALTNLAQDKNRNISVNFVPERRGDVARSIQVGG